jgi:hypothetical protein
MNESHNEIVTLMLPSQLVNNDDFGAQTPINLAGAKEAYVELLVGDTDVAIGSTDEATPPILEECDTADGSYTEITDAKLAAVIPAATGDNKIYRIDVPMQSARKKYARVKAPHAGNGSTGANLTIRGCVRNRDLGPKTAAQRGYAEHVIP